MSCDYGCPNERDLEMVCANCGHTKRRHLYVHPHRCMGPLASNGVHIESSCACGGFTLRKPARINEYSNLDDSRERDGLVEGVEVRNDDPFVRDS